MLEVDASPFDLAAGGQAASAEGARSEPQASVVSSPAALCLHGLTGTPYEVRPLGEALAARGVRALGPLLPGHGETPERLAATPCDAWLDAARKAAESLRERHDRVFGVGLSMGGLLTLALAAEDRFDAIAVVGVPLRFRQPLRTLLPLLARIHPFPRKRVGSDIRDPEARRRHPSLPVMPLAAVRQLQHLQRRVAPALGRVRVPALVAHGVHDRTARPRDAEAILAGLGSAQKQLLWLENSAHVVPVDRDGPRLAAAVADFLLGAA